MLMLHRQPAFMVTEKHFRTVSGFIFTTTMLCFLKRIILICACILLMQLVNAQVQLSIATDVSGLRNFSPQQKFFAFGQGVQAEVHVAKKQAIYARVNYHTAGNFSNRFTAVAKDAATVPQQMNYTVEGQWSFRQVSVGLKQFLRGSFEQETGWSAYGVAGFGLLFAKAENTLQTPVDTSVYKLQNVATIGKDDFKRLTFDIGVGVEYPVAYGFYLYSDIRTWLPVSNYPSTLLHNQNHVPLPLMLQAGMRVLFTL
jgi:hypothetical protein